MVNQLSNDLRLCGSSVAWARHILLKVGSDVEADEANDWITLVYPYEVTEEENPITEQDLTEARESLKAEDPGKSYLTKADLKCREISDALKTPEGRMLLRQSLKRLDRDGLLEILGLADEDAGRG